MNIRTQTRPNHREGIRDHVWGLDAIGAVFGILVTIITSAWFLSQRLTTVEVKLDATRAVAEEAKQAARDVAADLAEIQATRGSYLTKQEFYEHMAPEISGPRTRRR